MGSISDEKAERVRAAWPELLLAVADGENINEACKARGLSRHDVRHYRLANPQASREWELAREQSADAYADQVLDIVNNRGIDAVRARVNIDALKWLASKRNPRVYNDKATLDVNVRTVDLTKIITDANARLAAARAPALELHEDADGVHKAKTL